MARRSSPFFAIVIASVFRAGRRDSASRSSKRWPAKRRWSSAPDVIFLKWKNSAAGIITDLNATAVAAGIAAVLRDPAAARQMGQNGRNLVVTRFTWPHAAQQLINGYREVLSS